MARDKTHREQVERWARYVKNHPREEWVKEIKPFIDGQIRKANAFYEKLSETKKGREKIKKLKNIKS